MINFTILFYKAHVYHAHNFHVLPSCWFASKIHGGKLIYDSHETWTIHRNSKYHPEHIFAYLFEKIFINSIDAFITVNGMIVNYYQQFYNMKKPALVIYNTRELQTLINKNLIRSVLPIKIEEYIVIFVGGFWPSGRGIFELIESSVYLDSSHKIVLMGYGSESMIKKMKNNIKELNAENQVFILPPQPPEKVMDFVMSADIGANLIKRESKAQDFQSPWKLFEYCMGGLAIISTDLPFHKKVYSKNDIGILCETNNSPESIAGCIKSLLADENKLITYKINARKAAEREYNWAVQEIKLLDLYKNILS